MKTHPLRCYFLCYRTRKYSPQGIPWDKPTGGLVMEPSRILHGIPIVDAETARDVLEDRYHCGPGEILWIAEVLERKDQRKAYLLHEKWERDMLSFLELMQC